MEFKQIKIFRKTEDGFYQGKIEQIEKGHNEYNLLGFKISQRDDQLDISNRKYNLWLFSLFNGYRQIGTFSIKQPHNFNEGDLVIVEQLNGKIINVKKDV